MSENMINIGKVLGKKLHEAGITNREDLMRIGSKEAYNRLKAIEGGTCFNTLCALEGAVRGIRWHDLSKERKSELRDFFDSVNKNENFGEK